MELSLKKPPLVTELAAHALCYGLAPTKAASIALSGTVDPSFIHGTPLILESGRVINTAIASLLSAPAMAVTLDHDGHSFFMRFKGVNYPCSPIPQPRIVLLDSGYGGPWSDYVRLHSPKTIFATPLRECVFGAVGKICQFCTFKGQNLSPIPPQPIAKLVAQIAEEIGGDVDFAIGSGTPNLRDHGIRYFGNIAREVLNRFKCGISVELVPPNNIDDLLLLRESGVNSVIMSIEIWDDYTRQVICPGKSYVSKSHYVEAWSRAVSIFGRGNVSSVLLAGLDSPANIHLAIDELIKCGVVPTIIPFRPYDDTPLAHHPQTDVSAYLSCAKFNAERLFRAHLSPYSQRGCTACQGCSIDAPEDWST